MRVYKYYGNSNKDHWYLQHAWNWWSKILIWLINPKESCNDCREVVKKEMCVKENLIYCQQCYKK